MSVEQRGTGVVIVDRFDPIMLRNVVASGGGVVDPVFGTVTWTMADLDPGESVMLTVSGDITNSIAIGTTVMTNEVEISDDGTNGVDPTQFNNFGVDNNIINSGPDYQITNDNSVTAVQPGETLTYTLTVSNIGSQGGTNIVVTDTFSVDLFTDVTASNGGVVDSRRRNGRMELRSIRRRPNRDANDQWNCRGPHPCRPIYDQQYRNGI